MTSHASILDVKETEQFPCSVRSCFDASPPFLAPIPHLLKKDFHPVIVSLRDQSTLAGPECKGVHVYFTL